MPYVAARFTSTAPDGVSDLVRPFRIISGAGDGYFDIKYSNIAESLLWEDGKAIIGAVLQNGVFVRRYEHEIDEPQILDVPVVIYQYAFDMSAAAFAQAFDMYQRAGAVFADRDITTFNAVAVQPSYDDRHILNVFFIGDGYTWEFALEPTGRTDGMFDIYIPSAYALHRSFVPTENKLVFTTRLHPHFAYHPIAVTNPYKNHAGMLDLAFIRERVEHFFDNPATINHGLSAVGGVYTFNNLRTSVRYMPWHVIEYASFRTIGRGSAAEFASNFSAAFAFVQDDPNVINEFFLAGYDIRGRETAFRFGYVVDNFPLVLTGPWYTGPDCTNPLLYPIEVVVENGRVVRYSKIVYNFMPDTGVVVRPQLSVLDGNRLAFPIDAGPHIRLAVIGE